MRISSVTAYGHGHGNIILNHGAGHTTFALTAEENEKITIVAQSIVESRQAELARTLAQPFPTLADFTGDDT